VDHLKDSNPQKKRILDFVKRYEAKYGKKPKSMFFAPLGYDTATMFINAMKAVGTDGEKIRDYIESHKLEGIQADYTFSDLDHRGIGVDQASVMKIEGGEWVPAF
jgi:branched-chain amino acid transport system substrate-binding protein